MKYSNCFRDADSVSLPSTRVSSSASLATSSSQVSVATLQQPTLLPAEIKRIEFETQRKRSILRQLLQVFVDHLRNGVFPSTESKRRLLKAIVAFAIFGFSSLWSRRLRLVFRSSKKWGIGQISLVVSAALPFLAGLFGITSRSDLAENAPSTCGLKERQHIICWHPHGLYTIGVVSFHSGLTRNKTSNIYGYMPTVAGAIFKLPVFREYLLLANARIADKKVIDGIMEDGKSVLVCPGGIHEQLATDSSQEQVFFPPNLGFVRQALKHGVPLVPVYVFGENQLYDIPNWSRQFSQWLKRKFQIGFPIGVGKWNLPFIPRGVHISTRVGRVIEMESSNPEDCEDDDKVREVFFRYCAELHAVFNSHKRTDLPPEVAARGLKLVWRGFEEVDLSLESLQNLVTGQKREKEIRHSTPSFGLSARPKPLRSAL